ncbi:DNA polymerase III subunit gamma/tau [Patescibacteria group bacterium]|nr:DNA polymerase III subunit gamma/tau [Patescibacteria group bacterium]MBU1682782.1 DNA polymerase III subunit gamma/tau [Patescibacteria group bacterium]MBU1934498.1 DNA polymerase III subunit gamma/tau [Patescibacteria group bacterium]
MSLYLKYRPQDFKSVVGQDHAVATIQNALRHGSLTHAYLFSGPRGTGKTSLARIIAKALNCLNFGDEAEPCNECEICDGINKGRLVDLIEIDAASNRGIDEIRELREKIVFSPSQARTKVYIIDEVHMLTKEAFNALLKTLEEPPEHAYFILATTEAHKIPETIISRCQQFNFKRIGVGDIVKRLQDIALEENVKADEEALNLMAKIANGGLRDAIGLFEQMTMNGEIKYDKVAENLGLSGTVLIEKFFQYLLQRQPTKAIEVINQINAQGHSLQQFTSEVIAFLREQMLINIGNSQEVQTIIGFIDIFSNAKLQITQALIPQLPLEIAVIRACQFDINPEQEKPTVGIPLSGASEEKKKKETVGTRDLASEEKNKKEEKTKITNATGEKVELDLEKIKENWQRIIDHIDTPFIRMSFMDGEPVKFEEGSLHLAFTSSTLMDKIAKASNQAVVQKAFESIFGMRINLKLEVKKVTLTPAKKKEEKNDEPSVIEMAKEVFGMSNE